MNNKAKDVQLNVRVDANQAEYLKVLARRMGDERTVADVVRAAIDAHELVSRLALLSDPLRQAWLREQTDGLVGMRDATAEGLGRVWVSDLFSIWRMSFPEIDTPRFLKFVLASWEAENGPLGE